MGEGGGGGRVRVFIVIPTMEIEHGMFTGKAGNIQNVNGILKWSYHIFLLIMCNCETIVFISLHLNYINVRVKHQETPNLAFRIKKEKHTRYIRYFLRPYGIEEYCLPDTLI